MKMLSTIFLFILLLINTTTVKAVTLPGTNGKIAFYSNRDGNFEVYSMNPDGTNQTRLTNNSGTDYAPSWSPDGTKIFFVTNRDGNYEIYSMDADGSNQTDISNNSAGDFDPSLSPDGTTILFYSYRNSNYDIYTMNADGSNQTRLTNDPADDYQPNWSPDGTKIAFEKYGTQGEIYIMNADGSNQTNVSNNSADDYNPSFSPDGTKILFDSFRDGNDEIYSMNIDGSNPVRLTNNPNLEFSPIMAPDQTKIAFVSFRDGNQEIYLMNPDGSNQTNISNNSAIDYSPDWQSIPIIPTPTQTSGTSSNISMPEAPRCTDEKPSSFPYLFQADVANTKAVLHINPAGGSYNKYFIAFGTRWEGDEEYGVEFNQEHSTGALTYTINDLTPNTLYYFKTRAGNGCQPGDWSNNFKLKTTGGKGTTKIYTTFSK